jgi:hypothetical protein
MIIVGDVSALESYIANACISLASTKSTNHNVLSYCIVCHTSLRCEGGAPIIDMRSIRRREAGGLDLSSPTLSMR